MPDNATAAEPRFLLMKRGLFYRPGSQGYTGVKLLAGRFHEHEARPDCGVTAIHEDKAPMFAECANPETAKDWAEQHIRELEARLARYKEALTPSTETKAAYIGEFTFSRSRMVYDEHGELVEQIETITVPWDTTKEIMAAIAGRAKSDLS